MAKIAFLGLGVMGYPMAGHLATAGHNITVYNRTISKAKKWISDFGGAMADTPSKAVENAEFVMSCVGNDNDVDQVVRGDKGIMSTIPEKSIIVDHTTASAKIATELYNYCKNIKR